MFVNLNQRNKIYTNKYNYSKQLGICPRAKTLKFVFDLTPLFENIYSDVQNYICGYFYAYNNSFAFFAFSFQNKLICYSDNNFFTSDTIFCQYYANGRNRIFYQFDFSFSSGVKKIMCNNFSDWFYYDYYSEITDNNGRYYNYEEDIKSPSLVILTNNNQLFYYGKNKLFAGCVEQKFILLNSIDFVAYDICMGSSNLYAIDENGKMFSAGLNSNGQLGIGNYNNYSQSWKKVATIENKEIKKISSNGDTLYVLYKDGSLYGCGNNRYGQLGRSNGDMWSANTLTRIGGEDVFFIDVQCGFGYVVALTQRGNAYGCGSYIYGQLGEVQTNDDYYWQYRGLYQLQPIFNEFENKIIQIKCCGASTVIKTENGYYCCGRNIYGDYIDNKNQYFNVLTKLNCDGDFCMSSQNLLVRGEF